MASAPTGLHPFDIVRKWMEKAKERNCQPKRAAQDAVEQSRPTGDPSSGSGLGHGGQGGHCEQTVCHIPAPTLGPFMGKKTETQQSRAYDQNLKHKRTETIPRGLGTRALQPTAFPQEEQGLLWAHRG